MKKKPKQENPNRRKFLKFGFSMGAGAIAGSGLLSGCNSNEQKVKGDKMKVLLPNGELAEVDQHAIQRHPGDS